MSCSPRRPRGPARPRRTGIPGLKTRAESRSPSGPAPQEAGERENHFWLLLSRPYPAQPRMPSSIPAEASAARWSRPLQGSRRGLSARTSASAPPARPIGVRTASVWCFGHSEVPVRGRVWGHPKLMTALTALSGVAAKLRPRNESGQVAEWLKAHAWRACSTLKRLEGSNPSLSVTRPPPRPLITHQRALDVLGHQPAGVEGAGVHRPLIRVTRQLGQGGMGVVYAAHDDRLDGDAAIQAGIPGCRRRRGPARASAARGQGRRTHLTILNICHVYAARS